MGTNLFELIRQVAISLPSGMSLVVKEHPIMLGRRTKKYYEKLKSLPNVKLINPNILTNDVINNKNCELVTVVSGTSGFEAALLGKKVIQFSDSFYKLLPNVKFITDITKLTEEFNKIESFDEKLTIKVLSMLYENSFELSFSLAYRQKVDPKPYVDAMMEKIKEKV
jgi:UDP-N-acetylglucosamine 2-epimerase